MKTKIFFVFKNSNPQISTECGKEAGKLAAAAFHCFPTFSGKKNFGKSHDL